MEFRNQVLIVEDEASIRRLVQATLGAHGYEVAEAAGGEEGLALIEHRDFDLLVLDLHLPGISGWDVLERLKSKTREHMRVMILTARSAEDEILRGWRAGVDHYCMKPFDPHEFLEAVQFVVTATHGELVRQREEELSKTQLLHLVDNVFE